MTIARLLPRETAHKLYILASELEHNEQTDDQMSKHNRMVADEWYDELRQMTRIGANN